MSKWISARAAAELLKVSRPTVVKLVSLHELSVLGYVDGRIAVFDRDYILSQRVRIEARRNKKVA